MNYETVNITPEIAQQYISSNLNNRKLNNKHVLFLSSEMKSGYWKENGQSIVFDINGNLIDGQHRLNAICHSGCTIKTLVCTGAESAVMATIDNGRVRSRGDVLKIEGFAYSGVISTALNILFRFDDGRLNHPRFELSNASCIEAAKQIHEALTVEWCGKWSEKLYKATGLNKTQCCAAIMLMGINYSKADIERFLGFIIDGGDYPKSPSISMPRIAAQKRSGSQKVYRYYYFLLFIRSFELWLEGRQMVVVQDKVLLDSMPKIYKKYSSNINW